MRGQDSVKNAQLEGNSVEHAPTNVSQFMWHTLKPCCTLPRDLFPMKLVAQREFLKYFILYFWTCNFLLVIESRTHLTNVKVGVFLDQRSHGATIDDYNSNSSSFSRISLQNKTILLHGLSLEEISRTFCSNVLESNVTVIILQTKHENIERFVGHLASYFKVPVIGSVSQGSLLPEKVRKKGKNFNLHF